MLHPVIGHNLSIVDIIFSIVNIISRIEDIFLQERKTYFAIFDSLSEKMFKA
jgi:hypothetical protein